MSEKLKPVRCGCGGEALFQGYFDDNNFGCWRNYIQCSECGIVTKAYDEEDEAITAWNRAMGKKTDLIHCADCKWWDRLEDGHLYGYCRACRSGTHTERWEISIYRQNRYDFYCADAEPKEDDDDDE